MLHFVLNILCISSLSAYLSTHNAVSSTAQAGPSPLYVASGNGYTEVVDALLRWGANPNQTITVLRLHDNLYCTVVYCPYACYMLSMVMKYKEEIHSCILALPNSTARGSI